MPQATTRATKAKTKPAPPASKRKGGDNRAAGVVDRQIGELIRARRLAQNISQVQLAAALGLTFQQVQKYEKGTNRVAASTLMRIARALNCEITELLPSG